MKSSTTSKEAILSCSYDQLSDPSHQDIWLREALSYCGADDLEPDMSVSELEDLYSEILGDLDADADTNANASTANVDTPQATLGVSTGSVTPMSHGRHLTGTDHTTIGFMPTFGELPRDNNGKPDLSAVTLDNPPFSLSTSTSTPKNLNAPVPAPAPAPAQVEILRPCGKPSPDLRRAVLKRTQRRVNSAMTATQGGQPATASPNGGQSIASGLRIQTQSSAHGVPKAPPTTPAACTPHSIAPSPPIPCPIALLPSSTPGASSSRARTTSFSSSSGAPSSCAPATSSSSTQAAALPANSAKPTQPSKTPVTGPPYPAPPLAAPPSRRFASRKVAKAQVVPAQPPLPAEPEEDDEDDDQAQGLPDNDQAPALIPAPRTKRQRTQLRHFGPVYEPVMKKAEELIWLRMLTRCPFPEVTPAPAADDTDETDEDHENPVQWSLFDEWIPECWAKANQHERPGEAHLAMEAVHRDWILLQVPQPRTLLKGYLEVSAPIMYGFRNKKCPANIQLSQNLIHRHAFVYTDPDEVKTIFRNACIGDAINSVFFKHHGIGSRYRKHFEDMPISLIAFTCSILRHVICEYRDGVCQKENLSATLDGRWYRRYMVRLEQLARDTPTRLSNIKEVLRNQCLGDQSAVELDDSEGSIDLGSDSDPEAI
ncbi:hypothetical protein FRC08_006255 [Ceratobasidium sp. 394]|nr:hypothetical protein FRC08_006255 [Ceratobasidium sp. 394]